MKRLISEYQKGCELLSERIVQLTAEMKRLKKIGRTDEIERLNLKQRIALLYTEQRQTRDTIEYLTSYSRRLEQRVETMYI